MSLPTTSQETTFLSIDSTSKHTTTVNQSPPALQDTQQLATSDISSQTDDVPRQHIEYSSIMSQNLSQISSLSSNQSWEFTPRTRNTVLTLWEYKYDHSLQ